MSDIVRILICGSRNWTNKDHIKRFVSTLPDDSIIIEGEARGADKMSRESAEELDFSDDRILRYPAKWDKYGKGAGPIRNAQMLVEGQPTHVAAFSDDLESSRGTKNMVTQSMRANIPVFVNPEDWMDVLLGIHPQYEEE